MELNLIWKSLVYRPATIFTHESSYCFQHVLAIAILCLSVCLSLRLFVRSSHGWNEIGPRLDLDATLLSFVIQMENLVFVY